MENQIYLIYEYDAWLTKESRVLMGVFSDFKKAVESIINEMSKNSVFTKDEWNAEQARIELESFRQTQGFEINYLIKTATLDKLGEI